MKLNLIKMEEKELRVEVLDEGHTLLKLLQKQLLQNRRVEMAGYDIPHRLVKSAVFYIRTKGEETPVNAIVEASKMLKGQADEFEDAFKKALKKYEEKSKS